MRTFLALALILNTTGCATEGHGKTDINMCSASKPIKSDQVIKEILARNLFSFVDDSITVDKRVERFEEDGSYTISSARISARVVGDYSVVRGVVTIRSPQAYFNLPVRRRLLIGSGGEIIFCDAATGSLLPLRAIAR